MTLTSDETTPNIESGSPHENSGPPLVGDVTSFPSHAELARTLVGAGGVATLSTLTQSGHPYSSIAPNSILADGSPLVCVSDLAEHTQNIRRDPRASLLMDEPNADDVDPLSLARVTLIGSFMPHDPSSDDIESYLVEHPFARYYIEFDDFSWWRFEVLSLRYVGGFGFMGWATGPDYMESTPDPIIPHAAPMIDHLNVDHGVACHSIVRRLAGAVDADSASVTAIDRYGMTFDVFAGPARSLVAVARVAFPAPLTSPDQVRAASVELVRRAEASTD